MPKKFNSTSYNLFKVIKYILPKKIFSIAEIVLFLESENIFLENETVYKYLRTLEKIGFSFEKINIKNYKIARIPFVFSEQNNKGIINVLKILNQSALPQKTELNEKLVRFLSQKTKTSLAYSRAEVSVLEGFLNDGQRLKLLLKKGDKSKETLFEMYDILQKKEGVCLQGYDINKKEMEGYDIKEISSMKQTPIKNKFHYRKQFATLKFFSRVAKSYTIKEEDEVISKSENELIIKTYFYDKISFYKKILRYVNNCEVLAPTSLREAYAKYLSELYQMYDCSIAK